jgi:hypothetical protein
MSSSQQVYHTVFRRLGEVKVTEPHSLNLGRVRPPGPVLAFPLPAGVALRGRWKGTHNMPVAS